MAATGIDIRGARLKDGINRLNHGSAGRNHVIRNQNRAVLDLSDHVHRLHLIGTPAALIHDCQVRPQHLSESPGHLNTAHIGRNNHEVLKLFLTNIVGDHRQGIKMVQGDIEKTLNLLGVKVHSQDAVRPGSGDDIGHQFGRNWHPGLVFAVLTGVTVIRHHRRDTTGRGPAESVDHDQKFNHIVIHRRTGGLNDKNIPSPDVFVNFNPDFTFRKVADQKFSQGHFQEFANGLGQVWISCAAENFQSIGCRNSAHDGFLDYWLIFKCRRVVPQNIDGTAMFTFNKNHQCELGLYSLLLDFYMKTAKKV